MLNYGFQRLALIGSAGYQRAELPLDDSVSLIAPNNHGKTSLINALQFLLIIDQRRMDFGSHSVEKARRFYFPNNSAYILLEVILPQTGTVVFGCVGKGVGHDYEYFAYKGELNLDDYRLADGHIVTQPKLVNHLVPFPFSFEWLVHHKPGEVCSGLCLHQTTIQWMLSLYCA
ncbi:ATP-binding protein [Vibrio navarrensis]|uniref:ATP-binding protein n=1 Tax=Vibrio navarrensis TaxID=29495 RepID=UPI001D04B3BE|nr:ATP-binding protein [Vibrio navarrensis]